MKVIDKVLEVLLLVLIVVGCVLTYLSTDGKKGMVEESFCIHAEENGYKPFIDYIEREMTKEEYELLKTILGEEYINQGTKTFKYSSVSGNKDYYYLNGIYTIPYNVRYVVKWARNMDIDVYNDNFKCNRHYAVSNPNKEAYLIIGGEENGYQLIHIVPDISEESDFDTEYTQEGFEYLYDSLENRKQYLLSEIISYEAVSNELVSSLLLNKKDYELVVEYAKKISSGNNDEILTKIENGEVNYGIEMILGIDPFVNDYLVYDHGEFYINPESNWSVRWLDNIIEFADDENSDHKYVIDDRKKNAYALIQKDGEFCLLCFNII